MFDPLLRCAPLPAAGLYSLPLTEPRCPLCLGPSGDDPSPETSEYFQIALMIDDTLESI